MAFWATKSECGHYPPTLHTDRTQIDGQTSDGRTTCNRNMVGLPRFAQYPSCNSASRGKNKASLKYHYFDFTVYTQDKPNI